MSRTLLNWGIFLIVLGAIPLAVQAGYLDPGVTQSLLRLWPLILIGIGVGLLLRFTPVAALGGVIVAATAGMLLGAVLAGGLGFGGLAGTSCAGTPGSGGELLSQSGDLSGQATVQMELTCVNLNVSRAPGTSWSVEARHAAGRLPQVEAAPDRLSLRSEAGGFVPFGQDTQRDWRVTLPADAALNVSITANASKADVALGGGALQSLNGTFNAADVRLDLAAAGGVGGLNLTFNAASGTLSLPAASMSGNMTLNAASLNLCVAPDVGLRVNHGGTLSSDNFAEQGLTGGGDTWQTADYVSAGERIDLRISSNVSSVTLSRAGGCQ